jgi:hypothetical protein
VNENTVRSRLMQARKKLKGMLAEDEAAVHPPTVMAASKPQSWNCGT